MLTYKISGLLVQILLFGVKSLYAVRPTAQSAMEVWRDPAWHAQETLRKQIKFTTGLYPQFGILWDHFEYPYKVYFLVSGNAQEICNILYGRIKATDINPILTDLPVQMRNIAIDPSEEDTYFVQCELDTDSFEELYGRDQLLLTRVLPVLQSEMVQHEAATAGPNGWKVYCPVGQRPRIRGLYVLVCEPVDSQSANRSSQRVSGSSAANMTPQIGVKTVFLCTDYVSGLH